MPFDNYFPAMSIQFSNNELELIRNALRIASDKVITDAWNNQDNNSRTEEIMMATEMRALKYRLDRV